ncbi:MAG: histone deacetylase [Phototrophicales bacterium]|nr:MAG: histone deacetylase [Phototrophicales bacterium]RMG74197.1 MAG: histone deacetylase [Chloroflexota bacterium]
MKAFYTDQFVLPLPPGHRFPMEKYARLRQRVEASGIAEMCVPNAATDTQILRCHDADYLERVKNGTLTPSEIRRIGFPWSLEMVERSRRSSGATIAACYAALQEGIAVNLAGGTHHACRDHGEGFCVFNDATIAARDLQATGAVIRVLIVDCDVHQGNGTADITKDDHTIFTFSIHGEKNFPYRKINSDLDIGLPDNTGDDEYLEMIEEGIQRALFLADPDIVIYQSGADPFIGDRLGKLAITKDGLARRDRLILHLLRVVHHLPVAVTMGGGYAKNIDDIVDIHFQTVCIAREFA